MTQNLAQKVDEQFCDGYCCSEAIVIATTELYAPNVSKELAQAASSGLCGGMGGKKATCGVFTGGAVAIGLVLGKGTKKDKRIKKLSALYYQQLEQHAGGQICQQLLDKMGIMNWNGSRCRRLTKDGGTLLQTILETELSHIESHTETDN
jgi:C_GCAxxG_C_C family probable redox protein